MPSFGVMALEATPPATEAMSWNRLANVLVQSIPTFSAGLNRATILRRWWCARLTDGNWTCFFRFQVNDIHDCYLRAEFPTFKVEHPDWLLGNGEIDPSADSHTIKATQQNEIYFPEFATALNFTVSEIRELKLQIIEDVFEKYDFDGIELDMMRFPPFFPAFLEYRNAFVLTDFLRTVRQRLDERGEQRGRPIKVAVRVGENLLACRLDGFDIATWVDEELMDLLIVGDSAFPRGRDIRDFKKLVQGKSVHVYACNGCIQQTYRNLQGETTEVHRGMVANYWQAGTDGIYTFNWFPGGHVGDNADVLSYQIPLLKEIVDPKMLTSKDKTFPVDGSEYGPGTQRHHPSRPRFHNWMFASLPIELYPVWNTNSFTVLPVDVADDLSGANASIVKSFDLWAQFKNLVTGDVIDFQINGQPLEPMPEPEAGNVVKFNLNPDQLKVGLRLHQRGAEATGNIILAAVEIHVNYLE